MPRLLAPGPTYVPERIRRALSEPIVHHRTPEFKKMLVDLRARLRRMWSAEAWEPLVLCCSGTGAMEGAVVNFMRQDAKALVVSGGKFGERWSKILRAYRCEVVELKLDWGASCEPQQVLDVLAKHPDVRAVYLTSADTSTGVEHPVDLMGPAIRAKSDALIVVDSICDFGGARDIRPVPWEADVVVSCSQKCLLVSPGLGIAHVSPRAWRFNETCDLPRYYFDWKIEADKQANESITAWTSPVVLFRALQESLLMIEEEGLANVVARYARNATAFRAGMASLGLAMFPDRATNALTVVRCPDGVDGTKVVSHLDKQYRLRIANGQDQIKGKVFRVGHMGVFLPGELLAAVHDVESTLRDLGATDVQPGTATSAAQASLVAAR